MGQTRKSQKKSVKIKLHATSLLNVFIYLFGSIIHIAKVPPDALQNDQHVIDIFETSPQCLFLWFTLLSKHFWSQNLNDYLSFDKLNICYKTQYFSQVYIFIVCLCVQPCWRRCFSWREALKYWKCMPCISLSLLSSDHHGNSSAPVPVLFAHVPPHSPL